MFDVDEDKLLEYMKTADTLADMNDRLMYQITATVKFYLDSGNTIEDMLADLEKRPRRLPREERLPYALTLLNTHSIPQAAALAQVGVMDLRLAVKQREKEEREAQGIDRYDFQRKYPLATFREHYAAVLNGEKTEKQLMDELDLCKSTFEKYCYKSGVKQPPETHNNKGVPQ